LKRTRPRRTIAQMRKLPEFATLLCFLAPLLAAISARAYEPTSNYDERQLDGWRVLVNKQLLTNTPAMAREVMHVLDCQLFQITRVVPEPALSRLRDVTIWVEVNDPLNPCSCYHPSGKWVRDHGLNPEKATSVEISNATNFLLWTKGQPSTVLHELAHSYHHRVLGFENLEVKAAYEHAVESKSYESVLHVSGRMQRHYALTNEREYFAECSEAFFGCNDFYPFTRAELKQHDLMMFNLLMKVWGVKNIDAAPALPSESATLQNAQ